MDRREVLRQAAYVMIDRGDLNCADVLSEMKTELDEAAAEKRRIALLESMREVYMASPSLQKALTLVGHSLHEDRVALSAYADIRIELGRLVSEVRNIGTTLDVVPNIPNPPPVPDDRGHVTPSRPWPRR